MQPNVQLQQRREATPSRVAPGQVMGRAELTKAVNAYIWRQFGQRRELDARTIARYERGTVRWPNKLYREAFRACRRSRYSRRVRSRSWAGDGVLGDVLPDLFLRCLGFVCAAGALVWPVGRPVHEHLMTGVDQPVQQ